MTEDRFARYPSLNGKVVLITGADPASVLLWLSNLRIRVRRWLSSMWRKMLRKNWSTRLSETVEHAPLFIPCDLTDIPALRLAIQKAEESSRPD